MDFTLQAAGPFLHWLTLGILLAMPVVIGIAIYRLGGLPGQIAAARHHPQAAAIRICGWMGIVTLVLWPIAMVWAFVTPAANLSAAATAGDLAGEVRQASQRLAAIAQRLAATPPARGG
jgi:hypothetical protein